MEEVTCWPLRCLLLFALAHPVLSAGILYPRDSESRVVKTLDGMWNFRADASPTRNQSFVDQWWMKPLSATGEVIPMPVPSSYNDITNSKKLRDFVGWVWYDTEFFVAKAWQDERVVMRFGSAHYYAMVWVNGQQVMTHDGGHLPFEGQINAALNFNGANRVTVAVNNTLLPTTLPPGSLQFETNTKRYPPGYFVQKLQMDFFNYAGIHRHVHLYTTPKVYVDDITILTAVQGKDGIVTYNVTAGGGGGAPGQIAEVRVSVEDWSGMEVSRAGAGHDLDLDGGSHGHLQDSLVIPDARLWWPWTMKPDDPGYQYILKVNVSGDIYRQPFGIRTVNVTDSQILINGRPFYCHGVAKHEDSDIRGKGLDYALIARDFNMLRWLGANCFRTSHYPYAEEIMDQADQQGIAIIDECPGVGIQWPNFGPVSLAHHKEVMTELVRRDKNRPSAIMWSVANEPSSELPQAEKYFREVIAHTRAEDKANRPITFACNKDFGNDLVVQFVDVISINRYYGWYSDVGHTEVIHLQLSSDLEGWRSKFKKPVMITEYGADTVAGMHQEPSFTFTEEYQVDFMSQYHLTFDKFRSQFLVGEMVWNFADFMTVQGVTRVVGNRKGVLTRQRQPKASGHLLRKRYLALANSTAALPHPLFFHNEIY